MDIMFMGTPEFAIPSLEALYEAGHNVKCVITQPDKPKGRGHKMAHPPVYECAQSHGTPVYQPVNLKAENFEQILTKENPDLIVVVAYGKILPEYVLNYPKYGCVNVHGSLLPKYRGAAPMQWCLINGEQKTGITTMLMDKGLDTGDMLLKKEIDISPDDNYQTIHDKLNILGANLLVETIECLKAGTLQPTPQDDSQSCYSPMIDKTTACIDWSASAESIKNLVRGLYPFPRAYTTIGDKQLKIELTSVSDMHTDKACGTVVEVGKKSFTVACGGGTCLEVVQVQLQGKKSMDVQSFLLGNQLDCGVMLGK